MQREVRKLQTGPFDVLVIGGGIYGSWIAYHAAVAGLKIAIVEKSDWGSATSSASSKLLHGGLRYLERLQFGLVRKSLHERRELSRRLPHHVRPIRFLLPVYRHSRVGRLRLKAGLWLYDRLAGADQPVAGHASLGVQALLDLEPALDSNDLLGGFSYGDCGTDDARVILEIIDSALRLGVAACHYVSADELLEIDGRVTGARLRDRETDATFEVAASVIVNAAGPWVSRPLGTEADSAAAVAANADVRLTKGVHLVMPALPSGHAILLTAQSDGRVFFLIPWYGRTLLGTTDTDFSGDPATVRVEPEDVEYLLDAVSHYLKAPWTKDDIHGTYVGLRTLQNDSSGSASSVSREWQLLESQPGLLTSVGGKYTSARVDAAEAVQQVLGILQRKPNPPGSMDRMAWQPGEPFSAWLPTVVAQAKSTGLDPETADNCARRHGTRIFDVLALIRSRPDLAQRIVTDLPFCRAEVVFAASHEMARTLVDILRRRIPLMVLVRLQRETVTDVCAFAAEILGWNAARQDHEIEQVLTMASAWRKDDSVSDV